MDKIVAFFKDFKAGKFDFNYLFDEIRGFRSDVIGDADMGFFRSFIGSLDTVLPFIMMAVMLIFAFFGKKILPLCKFIFFFAFGFALGVVCISPLIDKIVDIPSWISGLILAILAAILYRFLYVVLYALVAFYSVFTVCDMGFGEMLSSLGEDISFYIYVAVAVVAVILAFVLRKYVEMLGTAALAGFAISKLFVSNVYNFENIGFIADNSWIPILVISVVIALPGFIVQFKTRKRY